MGELRQMPAWTYRAKIFETPWENTSFKVAGTLDGFIDLATPGGTYPLSLDEARQLSEILRLAVKDVQERCLHDRDALLK